MWENVCSFQRAGIQAKSRSSPTSRIRAKFDLGIFFASFESRCLTGPRLLAKNACKDAIVIQFREARSDPLRVKNDNELMRCLSRVVKRPPRVIKGVSSLDFENVLKKILAKVPVGAANENSKWFLDISGAPKPYYLSLLSFLRQKAVCPKLSIFHTEVRYRPKSKQQRHSYSFTSGFKRNMWVPFLWGRPDPTLPWTYVFLLGFEGERSYAVYKRFEPTKIIAVLGKPGYTRGYYRVAKLENKLFLSAAKPHEVTAPAADAVMTWKVLEESLAKHAGESNVCIVPLGTKAHAVAAGLAALTNERRCVLYVVPRTFVVRDVLPGKRCWLYEIKW